MPRVQVGNQEIVVVFQHGSVEKSQNYNGRKPKLRQYEYTNCTVLSGNIGVLDSDKETVGVSTVWRNPQDTPNRVVARHQAFTNASSKLTQEQVDAVLATLKSIAPPREKKEYTKA